MLRTRLSDETRKRVYSGQPLVASCHSHTPSLFEMSEEEACVSGREVSHFEPVQRFVDLSSDERKQHGERVSIAALRIGR
jgi:hypothetical protein